MDIIYIELSPTHKLSDASVQKRFDSLEGLLFFLNVILMFKCSSLNLQIYTSCKEMVSAAHISETKDVNYCQTLIGQLHNMHNFGVNGTLFKAEHCYSDNEFCMNDVEQVVKSCKECMSIDPSAIKWDLDNLLLYLKQKNLFAKLGAHFTLLQHIKGPHHSTFPLCC